MTDEIEVEWSLIDRIKELHNELMRPLHNAQMARAKLRGSSISIHDDRMRKGALTTLKKATKEIDDIVKNYYECYYT